MEIIRFTHDDYGECNAPATQFAYKQFDAYSETEKHSVIVNRDDCYHTYPDTI